MGKIVLTRRILTAATITLLLIGIVPAVIASPAKASGPRTLGEYLACTYIPGERYRNKHCRHKEVLARYRYREGWQCERAGSKARRIYSRVDEYNCRPVRDKPYGGYYYVLTLYEYR